MTKFAIVEEGFIFATVEARTAKSALRKATKQYPRRAADYNHEAGDSKGSITWRAWTPDGKLAASATVPYPSSGDSGVVFHDE